MPYSKNKKKEKFLNKHGNTAGLPLFDQNNPALNWPDWIWNGNDVKAEAYELMQEKFKNIGMLEYIRTMIKLGGAATDNEVKANSDLEINIITARRKNGQEQGLVKSFNGSKKIGPFGVSNKIWYLNYKGLHTIMYQ